jgi:hypothetical protein
MAYLQALAAWLYAGCSRNSSLFFFSLFCLMPSHRFGLHLGDGLAGNQMVNGFIGAKGQGYTN